MAKLVIAAVLMVALGFVDWLLAVPLLCAELVTVMNLKAGVRGPLSTRRGEELFALARSAARSSATLTCCHA